MPVRLNPPGFKAAIHDMPHSMSFWSMPGVVDRVIQELDEYAIFCMDERRRVMTWNAGAQRIFGFSENEMLGREADILFLPDERAAGVPDLEAETALREGRAADERFHLRKDGSRFWANGTMICVESEGRQVGFVKIVRDREGLGAPVVE